MDASPFLHQRIAHLLSGSWLGVPSSDAASKFNPHMFYRITVRTISRSYQTVNTRTSQRYLCRTCSMSLGIALYKDKFVAIPLRFWDHNRVDHLIQVPLSSEGAIHDEKCQIGVPGTVCRHHCGTSAITSDLYSIDSTHPNCNFWSLTPLLLYGQ